MSVIVKDMRLPDCCALCELSDVEEDGVRCNPLEKFMWFWLDEVPDGRLSDCPLVELIRCKDCKFYEVAELNYDGTPDKRCVPSICANGWYEYAVERDPNWFCADAERKESGDGDC